MFSAAGPGETRPASSEIKRSRRPLPKSESESESESERKRERGRERERERERPVREDHALLVAHCVQRAAAVDCKNTVHN